MNIGSRSIWDILQELFILLSMTIYHCLVGKYFLQGHSEFIHCCDFVDCLLRIYVSAHCSIHNTVGFYGLSLLPFGVYKEKNTKKV